MWLFSCKAQQPLPLNTPLLDIPANAYVKDTNNELPLYTGTYKSIYQGNEITLYITFVANKFRKSSNKSFYRDALVIKYVVKNSNGQILQDTQNLNVPDIELYSTGTWPSKNIVEFFYTGTHCLVGWGGVELKKISPTQISWSYIQEESVRKDCPPGTDTTVYLPAVDNLIFTKQ